MNIQSCSSCTDICCERTTYKLTNADIKRIAVLQIDLDYLLSSKRELKTRHFVQLNIDGTIQLKQPCYFLNKDKTCSIYAHRPIGCRLYPVVWNNGVTVDTTCQGHNEVLYPERHSIEIHKYMHTIQKEAKERREQ